MNAPHLKADDNFSPGMLRVLLLGPLRLSLQADACSIPFPLNGSQQALWHSLLSRFPQLEAMRGAIRLVRNDQFLAPDELLEPGDEVALVPPVSGG